MTTLRMIPGITYTRKNLEALTGMTDRANRHMIRAQRRQGGAHCGSAGWWVQTGGDGRGEEDAPCYVPQAGTGRAGHIQHACKGHAGAGTDDRGGTAGRIGGVI